MAQSPQRTLRLRGLQIDAARLPETLDYYRRFIDFSAEWGINCILFRLTDDQGSALRFASHPELITHKNALTPEQARELVQYAQQRGIEIIPEIESFGHSRYITNVPEYSELADYNPSRQGFAGLIPVHPKTLRLMEDLYREVATIFPSSYLHGGCDEVNWGGSELSRKALEKRSRSEIWADYLNSLNRIARQAGKELIVWADHVLKKDPDVLEKISKDIVLMDWAYWVRDPKVVEDYAQKALKSGHRVIGGPALIWCKWGPRAGTDQLRNIDAYADVYRSIQDSACLGVIVTHWLPTRYLQDSQWDGLAYASAALNSGSATARQSAFRDFAWKHYHAPWSSVWSDVFRTVYEAAPPRKVCSEAHEGPFLPVPWQSDEDLRDVIQAGEFDSPPFTRLRAQMAEIEPQVRTNQADFRAFLLTVEYLEQLYWRNSEVVRLMSQEKIDQPEAEVVIRSIAARDRQLLSKLDEEWNRGRFSDSPAKTERLIDFGPGDQLLFEFREAAAFSSRLAENPAQFHRLLLDSKK